MRCEHQTTAFRVRKDRVRITPTQVKCRRKARVTAGVPFGVSVMDFRYCRECAEKRVSEVFANRRRVVSITELPDDDTDVQPRDARGRFARAAN